MQDVAGLLEFVYLPVFERAIRNVLDDEACRALEQQLIDDPESGDQMAGTGGVRKLRLAIGGRGKSAGLRLVYYYRANASRIYLDHRVCEETPSESDQRAEECDEETHRDSER